jgi:predicted membrane-bound mannosyltransferase
MAIRHIAVFAILAAAYAGWTVLAKRKEAAAREEAAANMAGTKPEDA